MQHIGTFVRTDKLMNRILESFGQTLAHYLDQPEPGYEPFTPSEPDVLRSTLRPGDVLLIEGNTRISGPIKYLTQSTWSHAALFVGSAVPSDPEGGQSYSLIEATVADGVIAAPLSKYYKFHTRICRPVGLSPEECKRVCGHAIECIGLKYDLKNIVDLVRYLVPLPVPQRWRRRMIALGSGDPTRLICSGMIAQAFQSVRYPILPQITFVESGFAREEMLEIRHSSLFVPRDFDISPYFLIVKPALERAFDYHLIRWRTHSPTAFVTPNARELA